ncbi:hypothetical protein ACRAWF_04110 [Streptomyces sp. L7]
MCDALAVRHDTVVFWAARGPELIAFMNDFQVLPTCGGKLTVLGGDDITNSLVAEAPAHRHVQQPHPASRGSRGARAGRAERPGEAVRQPVREGVRHPGRHVHRRLARAGFRRAEPCCPGP